MLVLGRNLGDFIVLNDEIFITVCESNQEGDKFKIAIEAPSHVKIVRGELYEGTEQVRQRLESIRARKHKKKVQA